MRLGTANTSSPNAMPCGRVSTTPSVVSLRVAPSMTAMRELRDEIVARPERRNARFLERLIADGRADPAVPPADVSRAVTGMVARAAELAVDHPERADRLGGELVALYLRMAGIADDPDG